MSRDPLADPKRAIRRVYAYVAYRVGDGADAEDVTSSAIERAIRYRKSYDPSRGEAISWLIGIARTCTDDFFRERESTSVDSAESAASGEMEADTLRRLAVSEAIGRLTGRERDLIALRYGAGLRTRQIAAVLEMNESAVDVAMHRSRERLRAELQRLGYGRNQPTCPVPAARPST